MAKRADAWLRYKGSGKKRRPDSWYFNGIRLCTKDASQARQRQRDVLAGRWPPPDAADVTVAAFAIQEPAPASPHPPAAPALDPLPPSHQVAAPLTGDWTHAAAAASAPDDDPAAGPELPEDEIDSEQAAELLVTLELGAVELYVQKKYYAGFVARPIEPEGRALLVGAYRKLIESAGGAVKLPPWVTKFLTPAITVVVSSIAIVGGFRDDALKQKRTAEG